MKQSDPLQFVKVGSLERPGPVGRLVRLGLGIACMYALYVLLLYHQTIIDRPVSVLPNIAVMVFAATIILNYVVNIGFGKSWGRWPSYLTLASAAALAGLGWILFGTPDHPVLGVALWLWLLYFYAHKHADGLRLPHQIEYFEGDRLLARDRFSLIDVTMAASKSDDAADPSVGDAT